MEANQLLVTDIQGSAGVVLEDGSIKALNVGDFINVGDLVVTAVKSSLQIDVQGETLSIPANQKVKITPDLLAKEARDSSETTIFDESLDEAIASLDLGTDQDSTTSANSDVTDFLDALEGDGDILDNLEATAAGGGGAAGSGGGSSFVQLTRISENVDPNSVAFDSSLDQSTAEAFNLRDTSDGVVPDDSTASISLNELGITNSSQPTISGTSENLIGETVNITVTDEDGNSQVVTAVIGPDGTFEITLPNPIADGPVDVVVEAVDPDGNAFNDAISIEIDTTAPVINIDPVADSASQTVTVTGSVAGLNTGDNVSVTLTDSTGTQQTVITQVDAQGNWSITTTSPLAEGEFSVNAVAVDAAGNQAIDQAIANVDLTAPEISVTVAGETNNATPPLTGTTSGVPEGTEVTITVTNSVGDVQLLTAVTAEDGSWSVDVGTALPEGDFTVDAQVSDSVGNQALASDAGIIDLTAPIVEINAIADTQDTTPVITGSAQDVPAGSVITVVITDINGQTQTLLTQTNDDGSWSVSVSTPLAQGEFDVNATVTDNAGNQAQAIEQGLVDLTSPEITVTAIADTNDATPTFVGRVDGAPEGSVITVLVTDSDGNLQTLTTTLEADGTWSVESPSAIPGGDFNVTATVSDPAGNEASAQTSGEVTFAPISIQINSIADTNDTTPFLSGNTGNVPAGATITLTITASDGSTFTLLAVTQDDGSWTAQVTQPLPEGDFTVVAAVIDDSGNEAQASTVGNVDLTVSINFIIDTNDTTPTISGSTQDVDAGAVVTVTFTGSDGATETVQVTTNADGSWSIEATDELVEGQFTVVATVTDAAGNTASASEVGEIDLTDPAITINPIEDTNDTTPSVTGSVVDVPQGTEITLVITDSNGNQQTITAVTNADGSYSADIVNELSEGDFTVTASVSDEAGNSSTATVTGTVDLTPPSVTIDTLGDGNDTTPAISGSTQGLSAGSVVTVIVTDSAGAEQQFVTAINGDGTWNIDVPQALAEGEFTVVANVSDSAGNTAQDSQAGNIDLTAPTISVNPFTDSNDTTPSFSGTTSEVEPGSLITVLVTDSNGDSQTLTAVVAQDGSWQVGATDEIAEGEFTITATATDSAGNEASASTTGIIDTAAPTVTVDPLGDTNDTTPTISGTATGEPEGTVVTITVTDEAGNPQIITTEVQADGTFSVDVPNELSEGAFTVEVSVTDTAGNETTATTTGEVDTAAPSVIIDPVGDTNDTTPTISGSATGEPEGTVVTITVTDEAGNPQIITTEVQADGTFSVDVPNELSEGEFTVEVSVTDTAGNETTSTTTGEVDTAAPSVIIDSVGDTNDTTPTISGTATGEPEGTVVTITVTDEAGNPQTITTEVQADGTFSVDVPNELSEGEFTVEVSVTDTAGNETNATTTGEVDTAAPSVIIDPVGDTNDTTPTISGSATGEPEGTVVTITVTDEAGNPQIITTEVQADGTFSVDVPNELSEGEFTVEVSVTDTAGNETTSTTTGEVDTAAPSVIIDSVGDTNDTTPTISGSATGEPEGTVVTITVTDEAGNPQIITTEVQADGTFSVDVPNELSEGEFTVEVSVTDTAGNETTATTTGELDTAAPSVIIDPVGDTNDTTPTISGTAAGEPEGTLVTITVNDEAGNPQIITTEVQADGTFSVDVPNELSEGEFTVEVSVTDTAGNETTATTTGEVDTTAPIVTINALGDTSDTTPTISGTVSGEPAGSTITLTVTDANGAVQTITAQVIADGSWTVEVPVALAEGSYSVDASISDSAGNEGTANASGTIDTSALTITINVIGETNDQTPQINGDTFNAQAGSSVEVQITDSAGAVITLTTTVDENGLWSVTPPANLAEGTILISATVTDLGGGTANAELDAVIDITPPTIQVNELETSNDTTPVISGNTTGVVSGTVINLTVTDSQGVVRSFSATTDAEGNWSVELSQGLASGDYSVEAEVSDAAGNSASTTATGNIDTSGPSLTVDFEAVTNDSTPTISGTSDADVGTSITVVITDENGVEQTLTTTVDANGNWEVTPQTDLNEGDNTIEVSVSDEAGNTTTVTDTITLDTQAPTLTIQTVGDVNDLTPTLQGTSNEIGGTVTLTVTDSDGAVQTITTTVGSDGHWDIEIPSALAQGDFTVSASITDAAGNESTANSSGNVDTITPIVSVDALGLGNDSTPVISGTSTEPEGTVVNIVITDSNGDETPITATVDANGNWQATSPELPEGSYSVQASITDAAGNTGGAVQAGTIDSLAPTLVLDTVGATNDSTPTISGSTNAPAGTVINISVSDGTTTETFTATVQADGSWSADVPNALVDGELTIEASVSDNAGNTTTVSETATLNTTAPSISINTLVDTNDTTPTINGTSDAADGTTISLTFVDSSGAETTTTTTVTGGVWSVDAPSELAEGEYTVTAEVDDGLGNIGSATETGIIDTTMPAIEVNELVVTNDTTPTITGTANAPQGSTVTVEITDSNNVTHTVTTTLGANGTWSVAASQVVAEGSYTVSASVSDAAGNTATATGAGEVDTIAPTLDLTSPGSSNDVTPTLSGTSDAVEGTVITFTVIDDLGAQQTFTTTVDASGNFSVEVPTALAEGPYSIEASISDDAGNSTDITGSGNIDTTAPSVSVDAPALTNDSSPTVTGTSDAPNSTVTITFTDAANAVQTIDVQTDANGNWSATPATDLAEGNYSVSASITDAAGNTGTGTDSGEVDVTPPALAFTPTFELGLLVTLSGTSDLPAGSEITITEQLIGGGVGVTYTTTTDANGNWSLVGLDVSLLDVGSVIATATDAAGNTRTISSDDFDNTPPTLTVEVDAQSNSNTPIISGTSDAGEGAQVTIVVTDSDGNPQTITALVDANGEWSATPATPLSEGESTIEVSVRDSVGNETTVSETTTIDTQAPTLTIQNVGDINDLTPTLQGTSNEIGGTVTLRVTDSDGAVQTITTTVGSDGHWDIEIPSALAQGDFTVTASITDAAGNDTTANSSGNVDTITPVVSVDALGLGNDSTPVISGTSTEPEGTVVNIVITDSNGDETPITATVDANGNWQATSPELPEGSYSVQASITDAAGNTGGAVQAGTIDSLAPTLVLDTVGATNDSTPTISGSTNAPAGTVINISVSDGTTTETFTATVQADGSWSADVPNALSDGELTIEASVSDNAGNTTTLSETATLNTTAPSISINALVDTNDTTPTINGTSDAADGTTISLTFEDSAGNITTVDTTVTGGVWSVDAPTDLAEGEYTVTAEVDDGLGNIGSASETGEIDLTAPSLAITDNGVGNDTTPTISGTSDAPQGSEVTIIVTDSAGAAQTITATVGASGTWSVPVTTALAEGNFTVSASVSDAAGNAATATGAGEVDTIAPTLDLTSPGSSNDVTPTLSGSSDAVEGTVITFTVIDDLGAEQTFTTTVDASGNFSVEVPTALAEGPYSIEASISDDAGNSTDITGSGNIDTTAPSVSVDAPALTNDSTPTVTGTSDAPNSTVTITFTDAANAVQTIDVQTDASGNWSATPATDLAEGNYSVSASITDAAGNTGTGSDTGEVDVTPPTLEIIPSFLLGNLVSLSGDSDLPEGSVITITEYLVDGLVGATYTATTNADGTWGLANITVPLLNLAYVTASASDAAGNVVTVNSLDFDNEAPALTVTVDALSNDATPIVSGVTDMEAGTEIKLTVVDSAGQSQEFTAIAQANGGWSVEVPTELSQGQYTVTAEVRDDVGNLTTEQAQGEIDSIAPTLSVNPIDTTVDTTPIISGTSDAIGADVIISIDGQTFFAVVGAEGNWQVEVPTALTDGSYTAQINVADEANNITNTTIDLTIDTQVPVVVLADITVFNTDTPVISGTSTEPTGTNVDIVITDSNGDTHTLLATVDASGNWQATAPSLPDGNYDVVVSITDDAGNTGSDSASSFVDTQAPNITIDALGTINNSTPTISGTSNEVEGTTITVTITDGDSVDTYTTTVAANGGWSFDVTTPLTDGQVTVSASITDTAGNTSSAEATATLNTNAPTININTIVDTNDQTPTLSGTSSAADGTEITVVITDINNVSHTVTTNVLSGAWSVDATDILPEGEFTVTASVTEDGLTSNATSSGVIDLTAPALSINTLITANDTTPTISGTTTAPQGAIVVILITDSLGAEQTVNATVGANGTWSVAAPIALSEGVFSVNASTTDTAGNPVSTIATGTLDITAPIVTINDIVGSSDLTPSVSGTVTGATVGDSVVVVFIDAQGNEHSVNTTVQAGGTWTVEASNSLSQGDYSVEVFITDNAGNTGDSLVSATIDSIAPEISIDQSSLVLTQDNTPLISGTSNEANTNVIVTFTDSAGASHQMTVQTDANGDWQAAADNILADGVYSVSATISDVAGNTSTDSKTGGEVDTVGPELTIVPSFLLGQLISLSGTSDLGEGKTVTVTLELAGDLLDLTYDVTTDANGDWELVGLAVNVVGLSVVEASATDDAGNTTTITTADVDASTPLLNAVVDFVTGEGDLPIISGSTDQAPGTEVLVEVIDSDNVVQELVAIVQADQSWAVQVPQSLAEGLFSVTVNVLSEVGITATQLITDVVDTISPTLVLDVIGSTSDSSPIIQGASDLINGVVEIQLDGGTVLTTTVDALGLFTLQLDALSEGQHVANVSITDESGNVVTQTLEFVVDTLVPVVDILPLSISNTDILTISGSSEEAPGTDIDVTVVDSNGNATVFDALVGSDGTWSLVTTSLPDGVYSVFAGITDAAGNVGQSVTEQVTIDTIPPALGIDAFGVLNTLTPTITGTSDEEAGSLITVNITDSTSTLYEVTTTVLGDGTWLIVTPALAEGDLTVEAISIDDAGNIATVTQTGTVSTTLPGLLINPIIDTSDTTPTINGTTDVLNGDVEVVITDSSGTATTYNTQAIAGVWALTPSVPLAEGAFTVDATVENSGLTSTTSLGGIVDLTPPTIEVDQLAVTNNPLPTITGTSDAPAGTTLSVIITDANNDSQTITAQVAGNGIWTVTATTALSEGSFSATASISDAAGNSSSDTMISSTDYTAPTVVIDPIVVGQDTTPTVTGSVTGSFAGASVMVMFTDALGETHNVSTTVNTDGSWSVTASQPLSEGNYSVDVSVLDNAGNIGEQSISSIVDSGIVINSGLELTADSTPKLTGTAGANEDITVSFIDESGTVVTKDTTAGETGVWSVSPDNALLDGTYTVTATATDESGNVTSSGSLSGLVVDTTPISFQVSYYHGLLGLGLTAFGTVEEGSSVYVVGNNLLGLDVLNINLNVLESSTEVQSDANGEWSHLLSVLDLGSWSDYRFITIDEAGNYLVKDLYNNVIDQGYNSELVSDENNLSTAESTFGLGDSIAESFSEDSALGDTTPNEVSSNNVLSTESIDLGNLSSLSTPEQTVQMSSAEPLNIDDVLINEDAEQLIALNTLVEDEGSAIAYSPAQSGGSIDEAAPAVDVQNQSEEMIKHLIENGNNQTDI
ncbi:Ig-like domain-containing protein [Pseudoalteromonas carrageenovora]|uniref:Bacterial Ig-like domain-containing protein n=2 Tax=Pseudoalteromonas TaxID=53246 RepID=A0A2K4XBJ4_PSEVC|nr:Ig-like domain-containing protein [Pseudoalteromonas carrageenovora]SOU41693.1 conserved protein of unknown function [Pseudoalteromonas carrageenovora IAM 12662]